MSSSPSFFPSLSRPPAFRALPIVLGLLFLAERAEATIGASLQMQLGEPSAAVPDPNNHDHYLQLHDQYVFDFDDHNGEPDWVSWDLTTTDVGGSGRSNNFLPDPDLPNTFYHVVTTDYSGSGYDRGHMCPSADRTVSAADNQVTFYLGQILPQTPDNNQGVWANFENYCRSLASAGNELLITSGPSGWNGSRIPSGVAAIPGYTWKIAVVVPLGPGSAVSRITSSTRVIAIKVPNIAGVRTTPWQNFVTSAAQIEADTGYTFFTNLPVPVANALRNVVDGQSATGAPSIVAQPSSQTTVVGGSATFSVTANGDAPLSYQWLKNDDVSIDGATGPTLTLSNVQASDLGNYYVVVFNAVGSVTSNLAPLIISGLPPAITTSPVSQTVTAGSNLTLSVSISGSPPFTYQWRKDGIPISSATASALTLTNVQDGNAGSYDVVVTNSVGSATSGAATLTVNAAAPTITGQPLSKTASTGANASFTVTAIGSAPLTYQWRKDSAALTDAGVVSGATTATLLLTGVTASDAGSYDVVVTNALGSIVSNAAPLTVNPPAPSTVSWNFGPSAAPTADPSSGLNADISGGTLTQGNNNGTTPLLSTTSASSGYTGASGSNNAGAAACTGALNPGANGSAYFEFTLAPSAGKRLLTTGINFGMRSTGTGPQAFGVYTSIDGFVTPVASGSVPNDGNWHRYAPAFAPVTGTAGASITYRIYGYNGVGTASQNTANWRLDDLNLAINAVFPPPVPPMVASTSPLNGATAVPVSSPIVLTFNEAVSFNGSWFSLTSAAQGPMAATVTGGPTVFTLTPPSFFANNDTVTVTVFGGKVVDQATGTIHGTSDTSFSFSTEAFVPPAPPIVTTQPATQTIYAGGNVSFSVEATGTAPLTYQWRKDGVNLSGNASAASSAFTLTSVTLADAGSYDCVVSNVAGNDVSHVAVLTVSLVPPSITTQPVGQSAALGASAVFTVGVSGTGPFTYQWRKDGVPLEDNATRSGSATATLALNPLTYTDGGAYDVIVTSAAGSATSNAAILVVTETAPSVIYWDFGTANPASGVPPGVTGGTVSQGNNNGTTALITITSASSGYTGASGGNNAGAAARVGGLNPGANGSAYFEFTFAPAADRQFAATAMSFGMRSTGTGPKAYAIFSSVDNFTTPLAGGPVFADSAWHLITPVFSGITGAAGAPVTFRLYGYNGAGAPAAGTANWRIDDLKLTAGVVAVPLPPNLSIQPVAQTATVGETVTFSVVAGGTPPLTYQWRKDGVALVGNASAATDTLTLASIAAADAGSYDCVVSNQAGATSSLTAVLSVNKAIASVALDGLSFTYDGAPHSASVATAPAGLNVVLTYNGSDAPPVDAGSYAVVATIDDANYAGSSTGTLVIGKAVANVSLSQLTQPYDGAPKSASVATDPEGLNVFVVYNGVAAAPTEVGSYFVAAIVLNPNYVGSANGTFVITKASATVALSDLVQAYDGTPKAATVTTVPANLSVNLSYDGDGTAPILPGSHPVVATITDPHYVGTATDHLTVTVTALVRHAPTLNGGLDGSLQFLLGESMALNSSSWVSGDLLAPGTPNLVLNGHPNYGATQDGSGAVAPSNYSLTMNGGAVLRRVVRRVDPLELPTVAAPPVPTGTRNLSLNSGPSPVNFSTLRNLTLNGNVGQVVVPAGTYGHFTANNGSGFTLGEVGAAAPTVYNFQGLTLNSGAQVQVVGPVVITVASGATFNAVVGAADHPEWLTLKIASGGVTINSNATFNGAILAPSGTVTLYGTIKGTIASDRLIVSGNALLGQP